MIDIKNYKAIDIHGKEYFPVSERVRMCHDDHNGKPFSITTELLPREGEVVVKATVVTNRGTFTGISSANPNKAIEKMSPYEVAETSAVGRALGFAGYGIVDSIASVDEMVKAGAVKKGRGRPATERDDVPFGEIGGGADYIGSSSDQD